MNLRRSNEDGKEDAREGGGLRFDRTVRISDLLTVVLIIASAITVYSSLDKRVALTEQGMTQIQDTVREVKSDVHEIRRVVEETQRSDRGHSR